MRLLLDTNVLSEVTKPQPDLRVLRWLDGLDEEHAFISVVSIAEIRRGVALMEAGRKRDVLAQWLANDLPQRFEHRVISIDNLIALAWGDLMAIAKRNGRGVTSMDGLIAATALAYDFVLATRNIKDFIDLGVSILNPWEID